MARSKRVGIEKVWWEDTPPNSKAKQACSLLIRVLRNDTPYKQITEFLEISDVPEEVINEVESITKEIETETTIAIDLDGTLADYEGGWEEHSEIPGEPLNGVRGGLLLLKNQGFKIGILTTRKQKVVRRWLNRHSLTGFIDWINENPDNPDGTSAKPFYHYYVGDRAWHFPTHIGQSFAEFARTIIRMEEEKVEG